MPGGGGGVGFGTGDGSNLSFVAGHSTSSNIESTSTDSFDLGSPEQFSKQFYNACRIIVLGYVAQNPGVLEAAGEVLVSKVSDVCNYLFPANESSTDDLTPEVLQYEAQSVLGIEIDGTAAQTLTYKLNELQDTARARRDTGTCPVENPLQYGDKKGLVNHLLGDQVDTLKGKWADGTNEKTLLNRLETGTDVTATDISNFQTHAFELASTLIGTEPTVATALLGMPALNSPTGDLAGCFNIEFTTPAQQQTQDAAQAGTTPSPAETTPAQPIATFTSTTAGTTTTGTTTIFTTPGNEPVTVPGKPDTITATTVGDTTTITTTYTTSTTPSTTITATYPTTGTAQAPPVTTGTAPPVTNPTTVTVSITNTDGTTTQVEMTHPPRIGNAGGAGGSSGADGIAGRNITGTTGDDTTGDDTNLNENNNTADGGASFQGYSTYLPLLLLLFPKTQNHYKRENWSPQTLMAEGEQLSTNHFLDTKDQNTKNEQLSKAFETHIATSTVGRAKPKVQHVREFFEKTESTTDSTNVDTAYKNLAKTLGESSTFNKEIRDIFFGQGRKDVEAPGTNGTIYTFLSGADKEFSYKGSTFERIKSDKTNTKLRAELMTLMTSCSQKLDGISKEWLSHGEGDSALLNIPGFNWVFSKVFAKNSLSPVISNALGLWFKDNFKQKETITGGARTRTKETDTPEWLQILTEPEEKGISKHVTGPFDFGSTEVGNLGTYLLDPSSGIRDLLCNIFGLGQTAETVEVAIPTSVNNPEFDASNSSGNAMAIVGQGVNEVIFNERGGLFEVPFAVEGVGIANDDAGAGVAGADNTTTITKTSLDEPSGLSIRCVQKEPDGYDVFIGDVVPELKDQMSNYIGHKILTINGQELTDPSPAEVERIIKENINLTFTFGDTLVATAGAQNIYDSAGFNISATPGVKEAHTALDILQGTLPDAATVTLKNSPAAIREGTHPFLFNIAHVPDNSGVNLGTVDTTKKDAYINAVLNRQFPGITSEQLDALKTHLGTNHFSTDFDQCMATEHTIGHLLTPAGMTAHASITTPSDRDSDVDLGTENLRSLAEWAKDPDEIAGAQRDGLVDMIRCIILLGGTFSVCTNGYTPNAALGTLIKFGLETPFLAKVNCASLSYHSRNFGDDKLKPGFLSNKGPLRLGAKGHSPEPSITYKGAMINKLGANWFADDTDANIGDFFDRGHKTKVFSSQESPRLGGANGTVTNKLNEVQYVQKLLGLQYLSVNPEGVNEHLVSLAQSIFHTGD